MDSRVKERSSDLPLLVKPNEPISGIRLSSGISHSRKRNSYTDNSARFGLQQLFDNLHDLCQLAFSLTLFSGLPFWYVAMLSSRRSLPTPSPSRTVRAAFTAYGSSIWSPFKSGSSYLSWPQFQVYIFYLLYPIFSLLHLSVY